MIKYLKFISIAFVIFFLGLHLLPVSHAAFYKYVDENGRIFYVDDLGKVPEAYRDQIKVFQEKYDDLSEQERSEAQKKERERIQQQEQLKQHRLTEQLEEARALEAEDKKRKAARARKRRLENMETRVIVEGNRILVPVTIVNKGIELNVNLVLDTGASQIVLHRDVAQKLSITALKKGTAQVAGGSNVYVERGQVNQFKVGPHNMEPATVLVMAYDGPPVSYGGLLGMNFLKNVPYTIDYQNQVIRWQSPDMASSDN
ncbi:hypothetical protein D1AOALGA4SA_12758 [Olavius algarvensis Delta 1 endosymbiont]|nr:hypothetical protein D1AOALGA4SA_12758 [Olavius algarvensis Delta 1 endosymbiont]